MLNPNNFNKACEYFLGCLTKLEPSVYTPETLKTPSFDSFPEKSRKQYAIAYTSFMEWKSQNNLDSLSENVLLDYFTTISKTYKSSSLWKHYSMLRSTLTVNNNVYIETYTKLRAFLKRKSEGYRAKKAETFSPEEIKTFIREAPDNVYLATKVALIMGIMGACRANELHSMTVEHVKDLGSAMLVTVPSAKSKVVRKFTITDGFYRICKKYCDLRPPQAPVPSFFLNYQKGKCTSQKIGINKFGTMGKEIAKYLKLPNPEMYTGHCFRRSSAILGLDAEGDITTLRKQGWRGGGDASEELLDMEGGNSSSCELQPPVDVLIKNENFGFDQADEEESFAQF